MFIDPKAFSTSFNSCVPTTAANSSNRGSVMFFNGLTLYLAITNATESPCFKYTTAPYAFMLASANTCISNAFDLSNDVEIVSLF